MNQVEHTSHSREVDSQQILSFDMGQNTPERKDCFEVSVGE